MTATKEDRGITLIALVITIIILLILAGISVVQLKGNGLLEKVKIAKENSDFAQELENKMLSEYMHEIDKYSVDGTRNVIEDNVLWEGSIKDEGEIATLNDSIENYKYLLIQTQWVNTKAVNNTLIDTKTIKEIGYFPDNYSIENSHVFICMYDTRNKVVAFKSDKLMVITCTDQSVNYQIKKIIGIK